MTKSTAVPIRDIVKQVILSWDTGAQRTNDKIIAAWAGLAGRAARHSRVAAVRSKIVTVHVDSSPWLCELRTKKEALLKKLRKVAGGEINDIRFRIGEV